MERKVGAMALLFALVFTVPALAGGPPPVVRTMSIGLEGSQPAVPAVEIVRDRSLTMTANLSGSAGEVEPTDVVWSATPEGVVTIESVGNGRAKIKAVRDIFDAPANGEPKAQVKACVGGVCSTVRVTCLANVQGAWKAILAGRWRGLIDHDEKRDLNFVQDGRKIVFAPDPGKTAVLKLDGLKVVLIDGGGVLTVFDGEFVNRSVAKGKFASVYGFVGNWTADRSP